MKVQNTAQGIFPVLIPAAKYLLIWIMWEAAENKYGKNEKEKKVEQYADAEEKLDMLSVYPSNDNICYYF